MADESQSASNTVLRGEVDHMIRAAIGETNAKIDLLLARFIHGLLLYTEANMNQNLRFITQLILTFYKVAIFFFPSDLLLAKVNVGSHKDKRIAFKGKSREFRKRMKKEGATKAVY